MSDKKNDAQKRIDTFMKRYEALVKELKVDFFTYPAYVPDGQGAFRTVIQTTPMDTTETGIKSPIIPEK